MIRLESSSSSFVLARRLFIGAAPLLVMTSRGVFGQTSDAGPSAASNASAPPGGSEFMAVFGHLNPFAIAMIAAGALIFLLLGLRIVSMIRRESKTIVPPPRARRGSGVKDTTAPLVANTDWGFDQNKRASVSRATVVDEPAFESRTTQWSRSEVINATEISMQPNDAMGKPRHLPPSPYRTSHNPYYQGERASTPIEVNEVADTLLQAELLVQLGDPKQAMTLLSQHIRDVEKPGPGVWLMLLNLYQTTGRKSQYEALSAGFRTLFNAEVPAWPESLQVAARDLEGYPQVMSKLQTGWPGPEVGTMLESLLNDDRGGSRQGFSLTAYRDILFLIEILAILDDIGREDTEQEEIKRKLAAPL